MHGLNGHKLANSLGKIHSTRPNWRISKMRCTSMCRSIRFSSPSGTYWGRMPSTNRTAWTADKLPSSWDRLNGIVSVRRLQSIYPKCNRRSKVGYAPNSCLRLLDKSMLSQTMAIPNTAKYQKCSNWLSCWCPWRRGLDLWQWHWTQPPAHWCQLPKMSIPSPSPECLRCHLRKSCHSVSETIHSSVRPWTHFLTDNCDEHGNRVRGYSNPSDAQEKCEHFQSRMLPAIGQCEPEQ